MYIIRTHLHNVVINKYRGIKQSQSLYNTERLFSARTTFITFFCTMTEGTLGQAVSVSEILGQLERSAIQGLWGF